VAAVSDTPPALLPRAKTPRPGALTAALFAAGAAATMAWRREPGGRETVEQRREALVARYGVDPTPERLESVRCFRCDVEGRQLYALEPFAVARCPECSQVFVSPRLNAQGRLALYGDVAYFDDGVYRNQQASYLQRTWSRGRLDLIAAVADPAGKELFEIGCAYGLFLEAARDRGFDVAGLEFSPVAARTARERVGCEVFTGEVEQLEREDTADVVAFWDVLEHVPDPAAFMAAVARMVRPGGLVALSCPYYDSLPARVFRSRWWSLKPHKHIWHFTTDGLVRLLTDHDLEPVQMVRNPLNGANLSRLDSLVAIARRR
jgi:SAM-dependent methyltransferase